MSKTNAPPDSRPVFRSPDSKPANTPERSSAYERNSGPQVSEQREFSAPEIAALRAFFELLDQWDRKERSE
jgi:hypothetical protein